MRSHTYEFQSRSLAIDLLITIAPAAAFAVLIHLGATFDLLPRPKPILDVDRTILCHQAEFSRTEHPANVVLVGDSSCLMDIDPSTFNSPSNPQVLNLGTLSYLEWIDYAVLVRHFADSNPEQLRTIVLLLHPETLRSGATSEFHRETLHSYYDGRDMALPGEPIISRAIGVGVFKARILSRVLPLPLPGSYGQLYGFNLDLWNYLSDHRGSAVDPGLFELAAAQGNRDYRLSARAPRRSAAFRERLPSGVKLLIGITPIPEGFAAPDYSLRYTQMLDEWGEAIQADGVLRELPATLPDADFASTTHLNAAGQKKYTLTFERILAAHLE